MKLKDKKTSKKPVTSTFNKGFLNPISLMTLFQTRIANYFNYEDKSQCEGKTKLHIADYQSLPEIRTDENSEETRFIKQFIEGVSLSSPPGIAGDICNDLALQENRPLPELRPLAALTTLSFVGRKLQCYGGGNLRIFGLCIALSAAGKEAPQAYIKSVLESLSLGAKIQSKPRSDKNIIEDVVSSEEVLYILDEVHSLFRQGLGKNAAAFEMGMISVLLELATSENYVMPSKIRLELIERFKSQINYLQDRDSLDERSAEQLLSNERILKRLEGGWGTPFVSFLGYSTPRSLDFLFSDFNIETGLLARFIILRASEKRHPINLKKGNSNCYEKRPSPEIIERLNVLKSNDAQLEMSDDGMQALQEVTDILEKDSFLNHAKLGALYARGRRSIVLVASLLAAEERVITIEHIRYATALFFENISACKEALDKNGKQDSLTLLLEAKRVITSSLKGKRMQQSVLASKMTNCSSLIRKAKSRNTNICYELISELKKDGTISEENKLLTLTVSTET